MNRKTRFTVPRLLLAVLLTAFFSSVGLVFYQVGSYKEYLDAYSGDIARQDETQARAGLKDLQYFYQLGHELDIVGLGETVDEYFFRDFPCYRAAFFYLTKSYDQSVKELIDQQSFCAAFLRGNARWRQAQAMTANALSLPDEAKKAEQLEKADDMAATVVKDDYETALKANPSDAHSSWDFDMTSDPNARAVGLLPKPGRVRVRLGPASGGNRQPGPEGDEDDKEGLGKKSKDLDTKDPGPGRPDGRPGRVG